MSVAEMVLLGLVQGITEFLPISSSGHLVIVEHFLDTGLASNESAVLLLHIATLAAVLLYYRCDVIEILRSILGSSQSSISFSSLVIATIPAVIVALLFESYIDKAFSSPKAAIFFLSCTGAILCVAQRYGRNIRSAVSGRDAVVIGCFQALAILPGISRSGSTLSAGMLLGIDANRSLRFSFILSIPAIIGASLFKMESIIAIERSAIFPLSVGMAVAFAASLASISLLVRIVASQRLYFFAIYCWIAAAVSYALL